MSDLTKRSFNRIDHWSKSIGALNVPEYIGTMILRRVIGWNDANCVWTARVYKSKYLYMIMNTNACYSTGQVWTCSSTLEGLKIQVQKHLVECQGDAWRVVE